MRTSVTPVVLLISCLVVRLWAADGGSGAPTFVLPEVGEKPAPSRFSAAQVGYVQSWIRQAVPECPVELTPGVAEDFLQELQQRHPERLGRLLSPDFPSRDYTSMLLRHVGARLAGAAQAPLREKIAARRVAALLALATPGTATDLPAAVGLLAKVRDSSAVQHRRLLEGRLDADDLLLLLKQARAPGEGAPVGPVPATPKVLTAGDIVAEFSRRNLTGTALQRWQAYSVEGQITGPAGEVQDLLLFKMRPDRFRLMVRSGGLTRYVLAADGDNFWQQQAGQPPQFSPAKNMGSRRHLGEFIDPMFVGEGYHFERLADGGEGDRKFHRIEVRRPDGSSYVARIDVETFREVGRENADRSTTRYSDFREVMGLTLAFHEEATDEQGRKSVLVLTRITPNPGLIRDFFQPPVASGPDYFQLEKIWAGAPAAAPLRLK